MHTGQIIVASVTKSEKGLDFTLSGVTKVTKAEKYIHLKVTQETDSIAIGYGPTNDRSKRQIKKLNIDNSRCQKNKS